MTEGNWDSWHTALMWIIPAKVEGTWNLGTGLLTILQEYQMIYGSLKVEDKTSIIKEGKINGEVITFNVNGAQYRGKISGEKTMSGIVASGSGSKDWIATLAESVN